MKVTSSCAKNNLRKLFSFLYNIRSALIEVAAMLVGGRSAVGASVGLGDENEGVDGTLTLRIFQTMRLQEAAASSVTLNRESCEKLERAVLFYLDQFRKSYIGDQAKSSVKVYEPLGAMGITEDTQIVTILLNKILTSFKTWPKSESVIIKAMDLFQELATGYGSSRMLAKLETTNQFLTHHTVTFIYTYLHAEFLFPFLRYSW
jgi:hypothetical protein